MKSVGTFGAYGFFVFLKMYNKYSKEIVVEKCIINSVVIYNVYDIIVLRDTWRY